jgi:hypothetical protein
VRVGSKQNDRKRGGPLPIHSLYEGQTARKREKEGYKKKRGKMKAERITKEL